MKAFRPVRDVAALPTVTFGPRSLMWWGTLGFMTIEGWTAALIVVAYLYLRQNYVEWPPLRTPLPSLVVPTINLALMLVSLVPATLAARAGCRLDRAGVKLWLLITSIVSLPIVIIRWWDLWAIGVRWDTNAYGSAAWTIVGFHTSLILLDVAETIGLTGMFWFKRLPLSSYSDTNDNTFYWYFTVALWIPIYLIVYVGPRVF
jgi:heme/copper-type cytochrome/quinol oxidase subunit 3